MSDLTDGLEKALRGVRDDIADIVPDKMTRISGVEVPGLVRHRVYEVKQLSPYKPIVHYVGWAANQPAIVLSENPEAFLKMAANGGVKIASAKDAEGYAEAFLHVTRPLARLAYIVHSHADVKFLPKLSAEQEKRRDAFFSSHRDEIAAPKATAVATGFLVTVFMVVEQELRRFRLKVSPAGAIDPDVAVLETGLPLVQGGR